ncbi:MAG: hypothetical protein HGA35_06280 [Erysipelotrichaceae bacterium]|nr:hypothetical protein [Erysipelotrichaceae bacterium]
MFRDETPEETTDLLVPAIVPEAETPTVDPPHTGLIAIPQNTTIQVPTNGTTRIYTNNTGIYIVEGTIGPDQIATNRVWCTQTSSTSTAITWPNINSTQTTSTSATTGNIAIYTNGINNFVYYTGTTNVPVFTNGTIGRGNCKYEPQPVKKFVKNSIKRALKLLDNFGMEQDTKIFLKGDEVEISHPESLFKFVITKRSYGNIISATERPLRSVPFTLALFTKNDIHIANLCVYAENTPMLDNLFMIAMYVKSGNEEDLLRTANYFNLTKDTELKEIISLEYPFMEKKLLPNKLRSNRVGI